LKSVAKPRLSHLSTQLSPAMIVSIGSDHAGYEYKTRLIDWLTTEGHEVLDCGTSSPDSTDYPLFVIPAAEAVARGEAERGIVLGGSGNGEAIAANKVPGIRCGLCWNSETARLCRQHNNANVLSLGERMIPYETALEIVRIFLSTEFEGGRHNNRLAEIEHYEKTGEVTLPSGASGSSQAS
jgi:ribose 5-phosphate isomerase B